MIRFLVGVLLAALAGIFYAVGAPMIPYAQAIVAAAVVFAAFIYVAGVYGAPRAPVISHLYGLFVGALGLWCSWVVWVGVATAGGTGDLKAVIDAAMQAATYDHVAWRAAIEQLAETKSFVVSGFDITGQKLLYFWMAEAGLVLLAGLLGGHAGRYSTD